ncbi:MAG: response regulator, partial [Geminicoccaceae bacterium]
GRGRGGPEQAAVAGRYTVLVVEDDELVRMATVDMLRQLGHDVAEAGTGYDALDALRQRKDIDVLITDLGLPGMSGQELVAAARALRPTLPILLATGYSVADLGHDVELLAKPFMPDDLRRALANLDPDKPEDTTSERP